MRVAAFLLLASACVVPDKSVGVDPDEAGPPVVGTTGDVVLPLEVPDVQCTGTPATGPARNPRHFGTRIVVAAGGARHRGRDLIASADDTTQVIRGEIGYTLLDTPIGDEDVDVYACRKGAWEKLGTVRTNGDGDFALSLTGDDRLPIGVRDMFVSVAADRSAARFLAVVAPDDRSLAVTDVDGTLTTKEDAFVGQVIGLDVHIHDGASPAWQHIAESGLIPIYVTARPRLFTEDTRAWLDRNNMPRGPLRLAPQLLLPGNATVEYKEQTLAELALPIGVGIGNRATDIDAYASSGVPTDRIFIKLPEFVDEVAPLLAANQAIGFWTYPGPLSAL